jgi:hypothetical protein
MQRVISSDPVTRTVFHAHDDGGFGIETVMDVTESLDHVQMLNSMIPHKSNRKYKGDGFHQVGSIPMNVLGEMMVKFAGDEVAIGRAIELWLEDPSNSKWKAVPGRIFGRRK